MKRTSRAKKKAIHSGELRPEYNFDYAKAEPNRFAKENRKDAQGAESFEGLAGAESAKSLWQLLMTPMPVRRTQAGRRG